MIRQLMYDLAFFLKRERCPICDERTPFLAAHLHYEHSETHG